MKMKKVLALMLLLAMTVSVFAGCTSGKETRETGKFTYWAVMNSKAQQTLSGYDEMLMYQELAKRTGVEIDFIHPTAGSTGSEAFQILLTSKELPDMVEYSWSTYPGGAEAAIANKVIISLNEYLKEYAPNYYDYMEGEKGKARDYLYKRQALTVNGNYYGFNYLAIGTTRGFSGIYVRKDLLDKWGLDIPKTIDDWTNVFATAKKNGVKYPLTGEDTLFGLSGSQIFNNAWHVGKLFYLENDKVMFAPDKPAYKEYVKTMADWFKKGYVDPDYITNTSDAVLGRITSADSIAAYGYVGSSLGKLIPSMIGNTEQPDFKVVACPYPLLKEGDESWFQSVSAVANDPAIAITTSCGAKDEERYKDAIAWCDNLYSEEGAILKSFGVEGITYEKTKKKADEIGDDGEKYKYTYTSIISDDNDPGREEIGAHSVEAALYHYMMPGSGPGINQHPDYLDGFYVYPDQKDAIKMWNKDVKIAETHVLPNCKMTDEETERKNALWAKCFDTLDAAVSNIIMGKADISTYDAAVAKAKKDGMDEIKGIHQAAYDRYLRVK